MNKHARDIGDDGPWVSVFATADILDEVKTEVGMRKRVYHSRVDRGLMTIEQMNKKVALMQAAADLVEWQLRQERLI
jgi:predicted methyltransferase